MLEVLVIEAQREGERDKQVRVIYYSQRTIVYFFPGKWKLSCAWLLVMPASSAEAEQSFSALRRVETWLRLTIGQS